MASYFFFFQAEDGIRDLYVTGVQTCALPILLHRLRELSRAGQLVERPVHLRLRLGERDLIGADALQALRQVLARQIRRHLQRDRKSTRLNSSHVEISYAVFCLKKKKKPDIST